MRHLPTRRVISVRSRSRPPAVGGHPAPAGPERTRAHGQHERISWAAIDASKPGVDGMACEAGRESSRRRCSLTVGAGQPCSGFRRRARFLSCLLGVLRWPRFSGFAVQHADEQIAGFQLWPWWAFGVQVEGVFGGRVQVGALAAASSGDVERLAGGGVVYQHVGGVDGAALGPCRSDGIAPFDVPLDVVGGQPDGVVVREPSCGEVAVAVVFGDGPQVAVLDEPSSAGAEGAVVLRVMMQSPVPAVLPSASRTPVIRTWPSAMRSARARAFRKATSRLPGTSIPRLVSGFAAARPRTDSGSPPEGRRAGGYLLSRVRDQPGRRRRPPASG